MNIVKELLKNIQELLNLKTSYTIHKHSSRIAEEYLISEKLIYQEQTI